jgi:hypothetical protein
MVMALMPLQRLILGNLVDAVALGLIDDSSGDATEFGERLWTTWTSSSGCKDQVEFFKLVMWDAKSMLGHLHRPIEAKATSTSTSVATVMFLKKFADKYELPISTPDDSRTLHSLLSTKVVQPSDLHDVEEACLRFTEEFGENGAFRTVAATSLGVTADWPTWTAPPPLHSLPSSAQYWRDRLGLIHVEGVPAPTAASALVRVEFEVRLSSYELLRENWKSTLRSDPSGIWLIRPTLVHEGNRRFVQGHSGDQICKPSACLHGMTRDLASKTFEAGEEERLLVCGEEATLKFKAVTLLDGMSGDEPTRDNSDDCFVSQIASERGWPVA